MRGEPGECGGEFHRASLWRGKAPGWGRKASETGPGKQEATSGQAQTPGWRKRCRAVWYGTTPKSTGVSRRVNRIRGGTWYHGRLPGPRDRERKANETGSQASVVPYHGA